MKIVLTVHQFLPEFFTGTEILTFETAKELQRLGHEVMVFTGYPEQKKLADAERFDSYMYEGVQVERFLYAPIPEKGNSSSIEAEYNNQIFAARFRDFLKEEQPDLVHFFHLGRLTASAIDVCFAAGIPMVMTPTDFWLVCPRMDLRLPDNSFCEGAARNGINCLRHYVEKMRSPRVDAAISILPDWLLSLLIRVIRKGRFFHSWYFDTVRALTERPDFLRQRMNMLHRVVVPTRLMGNILKQNGLSPDKIVFSAYGINLAHIPAPRRREWSDTLRIGFIGTLAEHKGAHILLKAVRKISDSAGIDLKIYGDYGVCPEYVERLRRIAGDDKRISFCGTFPANRIGEIFTTLDVLVVPSIWYENTPLVIYSAQASGCPVIASDLGGMSEVVEHEVNGLLFEAGNASGLAAAIRRLVEDKKLLGDLSAKTRRPKSIPEYVQELLILYKDVLKEKRQIA